MNQPAPPGVTAALFNQLLDKCVAGVEGWGTAFFIRHDLLLTCTHVVEGKTRVRIRPFGTGTDLTAEVLPGGLPVDQGDLSLLKVEQPDPDQTAVLLHLLSRADLAQERKVTMAGYPRDDWSGAGYEPRYTVAKGRWAAPDEMLALTFDSTAEVTRGMSGGPVLDQATGTVVGVTRYSKGSDSIPGSGGGAVPISRAVAAFPQVRQAWERPPRAAHAWLIGRGQDELLAIGREGGGTIGLLDLSLSGTLDGWWVAAGDERADESNAIHLDALGVNVSRAVFQWTRGRRTSSSEDLDLVGDILSAALLHGKARTSFQDWQAAAQSLTVRLVADPKCELADLPWEYAKPSPREATSLGLDERFALVRVVPGVATQPATPTDTAPLVIAIAVQPEPAGFPPMTTQEDLSLPWPTIDQLGQQIKDDVTEPFILELVCNPPRSGLRNLSRPQGCAVLHYQGFVQVARSGRTQLAVIESTTQELTWVEADDFVRVARDTRAKVVVIEHSAAPRVYSPEDLDLRLAGPLLDAGVQAVLTTRFPVHPSQARIFNGSFYQTLARSETVERAVQAGRRKFDDDEPVRDRTSYGAFVLWTGEGHGLRIVAPEAGGPAAAEGQSAPVSRSSGPATARPVTTLQPEDSVARAV